MRPELVDVHVRQQPPPRDELAGPANGGVEPRIAGRHVSARRVEQARFVRAEKFREVPESLPRGAGSGLMPSSSVLIALARALKVSEECLLNPADIDLVSVEFRKKKLTSAREAAEVQARILSEVERYLEIEQILAVHTPEVFPAKVRPRVTSVEDVDAAAERLRKRWHLGDDAIPNLCEFLEEKGIKICAIPLPDNVSGVQATVKSADGAGVPVIVVNANDPGERQRFTVAHELGHLYLDVPQQGNPEPLCHRFAGAFLVPGRILQKEVGNYRHAISVRELFQLKQLFGVSAQAIAYRCKDLGIINQPTFSGVFKSFGIKKWRRNEPNPLPKEQPSRFERLCIRALAENVISEAKASELLRKTIREIVESLDRPPEHGRGNEDERVH